MRFFVLGLLGACSSNYATKEDVARLEGRVQALEARAGYSTSSGSSESQGRKGPEGEGGQGGQGMGNQGGQGMGGQGMGGPGMGGQGGPGQGGPGMGGQGGQGGPGGGGGDGGEQPTAEMQAMEKAFSTALDAMNSGDAATAKTQLNIVVTSYGDTKAADTAQELLRELDVIGAAAPPLSVDRWIQGSGALGDGKATMLVFFHANNNAKFERIVQMASTWTPKGLTVLGITQQSSDMPADKMSEWLAARKITFPVAYDKGSSTTDAYKRSDVVSGVLIKGGKVVWSGNPGEIAESILTANL